MNIMRKIAEIPAIKSAIEDQADLTEFSKKPGPRIWIGLILMGLSYIIGWPAIAGLGIVAAGTRQPMIIAVGGPLLYGMSHLVFLAGMMLAGVVYSRVFFRWAARRTFERFVEKPDFRRGR